MGDGTDFATSFHNLEGNTLGERKKSLFKLLKTFSFQNEEQLNNAFKNLKPINHVENLLYIDTLLHFKRTKELLELLESGNEIFISKIVKQLWFIEEGFKNVEPDKLVNDFLPYLSYSMRKKLLKMISRCWNRNKMDSLFDSLYDKYGTTGAVPILHKCTPNKIKSILAANRIELHTNQVLHLIDLGDDIFETYINHYNQVNGVFGETSITNYLGRKNLKLFLEMEKKKKICAYRQQLSKRTTKKCVSLAKDDLLLNFEAYLKFLKPGAAIRKLGKESVVAYQKIFPRKLSEINSYNNSISLLRYYPKNRRWNLFYQNVQATFSMNLDQVLLEFGSQLRTCMPKELLVKWAELNYEKQERNFEHYLQYFTPDKSIPLIKEKINLTSDIHKRENLIDLMIQSASEHKDLDALEKILQYICFRHRNEDASTRRNILNNIRNSFKLEELSESHWVCINEQIKILRIQEEFYFYQLASFSERYLEFLFKNKMDNKTALFEYINDLLKERSPRKLNLKNKPVEQRIYVEIGKRLPEAVDRNDLENGRSKILILLFDFSIENPEYFIKISELPDFVLRIKESLSKTSRFDKVDESIIAKLVIYNLKFPEYAFEADDSTILRNVSAITRQQGNLAWFNEALKLLLLTENRCKLGDEMLMIYFRDLLHYGNLDISNWFLKHEPAAVAPYFYKILQVSLESYNTLDCKLLKNYSNLQLDRKACECYVPKLDTKLVRCVRTLLPTEDFQRLVNEKYLPKKDKLDLEDDEMRKVFKLQCEIAKILAVAPDPHKILPTIMEFCRGDYLQPALSSLYRAFYRSPERVLYPYAEKLAKKAVSVRKHAVFLSCEILDKQHALDLLKNTNEQNMSSQKYLFSAILKYFTKNPSPDLLDKLIDSMNSLNPNDTETLDSLIHVRVPSEYEISYVQSCWKFFENLKSKGIKINKYLDELLGNLKGDVLNGVSKSFVTDIIKRYLPTSPDERLENIEKFVVDVLITRKKEQTEYFVLVFDLFKSNSSNVTKFFSAFMTVFRDENVDKTTVDLFSQYWNQLSVVRYLKQHIELNLRKLRLEHPSSEIFARYLVDYLDQLISKFGFHVYPIFEYVLAAVSIEICNSEKYSLLLAILNYKVTDNTCLLVLKILEQKPDNQAGSEIYDEIMNVLKKVEIPIVCFYFDSFLKK